METKEVENIAELKIRQYFDHYLEKTLPHVLDNHIEKCPYGKQVSRVKWAMIGGMVTLMVLIPTVGRSLLMLLFKI